MENINEVETKELEDEAKKREHQKKIRKWYLISTFLTLIYLVWRFLFTIPIGFGVVSAIAGITLFTVEFLGMIEAAIHHSNMNKYEDVKVPKVPLDRFPEVDVFIATYNESSDILYKTVNGCRYMEYPDKSKVHIYLCDDGRRPEIKELAQKMGVNYLDRMDNKHAKAGNLNNALNHTSSPLIVTFDADMIPKSNFLMRLAPFFIEQEILNEELEENEREYIGFVQSPQAFYNPDLFQFNLFSENRIPNEQDYFYKDIQVARNRTNSVIYGGSNTMISRKALEDIGGFYTNSITEDYATGILMQKKKFKCIAIGEVLASGLSPQDLKSLIAQRIRWARGVISTNFKLHIWLSKELTFSQKTNYWASKWYWYFPIKRLIYFISPILFAVFGYRVINCSLFEVLLFWLPMYVCSNISLKLLSGNIRTTKWSGVYETILFPFMIVPVLLESVGISLKKFKTTKKNAVTEETTTSYVHIIPFMLLVGLSIIGLARCIASVILTGDISVVVVMFWLCFNMYVLFMAIFFLLGRKILRKNERVFLQTECTLKVGGRVFDTYTKDLSEEGVSVLMQNPISIDENELVDIDISCEGYEASLKCKIVHVDNLPDKTWKYAFKIDDYKNSYDDFLQIIYDRVPTMPQKLDDEITTYDDLKLNIHKRVSHQFYQNRKRSRVPIDVVIKRRGKKPIKLEDINFKYISATGILEDEEIIKIPISENEDLYLECKKIESFEEDRILLEILNYNDIIANKRKIDLLEAWVLKEYEQAITNESSTEKTDEGKIKLQEEVQTEEDLIYDEFNEMKYL